VAKGLSNFLNSFDKLQNKTKNQIDDKIRVNQILTYISTWPLIIHLLSGFFCLGCSATFHLFWIQNEQILNTLSRLDYGGISILILGSSVPAITYSFQCDAVHLPRNIFLTIITVSSTLTFLMMMTPSLNSPSWRSVRAGLFIVLGLSAGIPWIYVAIDNNNKKESYTPTANGWIWLVGGLVYIGGAILYAVRAPEKCFPKKFDLCGASHQIFHFAVLGGFIVHF